MFNETTLNEMEMIDKLVSERNKSLWKQMVFLSWTFPTNHSHDQQGSGNYFCIWVGKTGKSNLKSVLFAGAWMLPKLLSEITDEELFEVVSRADKRYCLTKLDNDGMRWFFGGKQKNGYNNNYSYWQGSSLQEQNGFENYFDALLMKIECFLKNGGWYQIEKFKNH